MMLQKIFLVMMVIALKNAGGEIKSPVGYREVFVPFPGQTQVKEVQNQGYKYDEFTINDGVGNKQHYVQGHRRSGVVGGSYGYRTEHIANGGRLRPLHPQEPGIQIKSRSQVKMNINSPQTGVGCAYGHRCIGKEASSYQGTMGTSGGNLGTNIYKTVYQQRNIGTPNQARGGNLGINIYDTISKQGSIKTSIQGLQDSRVSSIQGTKTQRGSIKTSMYGAGGSHLSSIKGGHSTSLTDEEAPPTNKDINELSKDGHKRDYKADYLISDCTCAYGGEDFENNINQGMEFVGTVPDRAKGVQITSAERGTDPSRAALEKEKFLLVDKDCKCIFKDSFMAQKYGKDANALKRSEERR